MAKSKTAPFGISDQSREFLKTYMNTASPIGLEYNGQKEEA